MAGASLCWRTRLLAAVAAALCLAAGPQTPGVVAARATRLDLPLIVQAPGTAQANESVEIRPKISETVTAIRFEDGQTVEAGQSLLELESSQAVAAVAVARAALVESESQARRSQELFDNRTLAASELEQRLARRDADRAALDAARARLADTRVKAPFAGRLGLRRVSLGSLVTPETVITTLDDTQTIKLDFDVPETALSHVAEGLTVEARSAAWPEERFRGEVSSVDTRVDPVTRTLTVRARVANESGRLRPGMFLMVTLVRRDVPALVVPEQAIVPEHSRQFVLVIGADDVVEKREIRTGRRRPGQVEVLSGLAEGERVVAEGTQKARPGRPVEVVRELEIAATTTADVPGADDAPALEVAAETPP